MPGNSPYGVQKEYMEKAVELWRNEVEDVLEEIFGYISTEFEAILTKQFTNIGRLDLML